MKKQSIAKVAHGMRPEYDLSRLQGGVFGKYLEQVPAASNLVFIEPELSGLFPDSAAVNRALRVIAEAAQTATKRKMRSK